MEIISFVYDELYGDCFMTDAEQDPIWRAYLRDLQETIVAPLPDPVAWRARYRDLRLPANQTQAQS